MPIKGNKGEWSEIYVLLRLLSEGRIYAANDKIEKIKEIYYPILRIIREELAGRKYEYEPNDKVKIFLNNQLLTEIDRGKFKSEADYLYEMIINGAERAFPIAETETFMGEIGCKRLAAPSSDKTDITLQIHDIQTGFDPICGFSIKSEIGSPPTLINASKATNFIFEVTGLSLEEVDRINAINTREKIKDRMEQIFSSAKEVSFVKTVNHVFLNNLMLIDSRLPELLANALIYHYRDDVKNCTDAVSKMEIDDPMNYSSSGFYTYKFKKFLCSAALGMTPSKLWDGIDEANGGYIVVTSGGDVLAYHIYNRNFFESYLLKNTKFERGSTSRHDFAELYTIEGRIYLNLNLQIRFK